METNNKNVIVLALLIIGVSFFYANLGGSSGAVTRYYASETPTANPNAYGCSEFQEGISRCTWGNDNVGFERAPANGMVVTCINGQWTVKDRCTLSTEKCVQEGLSGTKSLKARCDNRIEPGTSEY